MTHSSVSVLPGNLVVVDDLAPLYAELHEQHAAIAPEVLSLAVCSTAEAWPRRRRRYVKWLDSDGAFVAIASMDGARVGYGLVTVAEGYDGWGDGGPVGEIKDIVVAAAVRRRGVATAIVNAVRGELARRDIRTFRLNVLAMNSAALDFYRDYGLELAAMTWGGPTS